MTTKTSKSKPSVLRGVDISTVDRTKQIAMALVYGYIYRLEKLIKNTIIPKDIHMLCFNFYFISFNSVIFTDKECVQFFELLSTKLSRNRLNGMKLLLRATRDGANNDIFREILPNNYPYLYVVSTTDGCIFGGYSSINISKQSTDNNAFIYFFKLKGNTSHKPHIYEVQKARCAIHYGGGYGLMVYFGSSGAIVLFESPTKHTKNYCGHSSEYGLSMDSKKFMVAELEIFNVPDL